MNKSLHRLILSLAFVIVAGCATIDFDYSKTESFALNDTADTSLGRGIADIVAQHPPEQSGFRPIYSAIDSLALRLLGAERAERSIDAQYFLIHDDLVGNAFLNALVKAANRGVRVRLLIDDIQAYGYDAGLAALDSHENIEIRLFNPFAYRKIRALNVTRLSRIVRRMHNKSFTIDNQFTLIGGRNIADEYFGAGRREEFSDLDVLAIGSIVPKVSAMFDSFWNHAAALPMPAISRVPDDLGETLMAMQNRISDALKDVETSQYADAVRSSILEQMQQDDGAFTWANYDLVYDSPDKVNPDADAEADSIVVQMREKIGEIDEELFVVTPYFVLHEEDIEAFRQWRDKGVEMIVLTNSLASNNHSVSHGGYAPARKTLLEMGIQLHEVRANAEIPANEYKGVQEAKTTLHAKAFTVDRRSIFIGSFNWNQRSINLDTELGVIIHSPSLANELVDRVSSILPEHSFEVFLNDQGELRWRGQDGGQEVILSHEPQTSAWHRFEAGILRIVPKSQL